MFKTAGVRSMQRVFSALSMVSLIALLGACTQSPTTNSSEPKSWVVDNVASKSTAELYADVIKPGVFERSSSKVIDGYTVESGNLRMLDKSVGSLVTVRSKDGSLTAFVEKPGMRGLLVIKSNGESRFTPSADRDYSLPDVVTGKEDKLSTPSKATVAAGPFVVDMLIGYTRASSDYIGGDVHANALAMVESVNLGLRNSLVTNVSLRLVGTQIVEPDYWLTFKNLEELPIIFAEGVRATSPDLIYGAFAGHEGDDSPRGYLRYRLSMGYPDPVVFRHEVGHNAGGLHCAHEGGGYVPYGYGYANGKTFTIQCGNGSPYYSNPEVRDAHGLPIGDAATADMARVWRENAERLSSYATFTPAPPTGFRDVPTSPGAIQFEWDQSPRAVKYEVWGKDSMLQPYKKLGESSSLELKLSNVSSGSRPYYLVAVYADGTKSPNSNVVYAKPYESLK